MMHEITFELKVCLCLVRTILAQANNLFSDSSGMAQHNRNRYCESSVPLPEATDWNVILNAHCLAKGLGSKRK